MHDLRRILNKETRLFKKAGLLKRQRVSGWQWRRIQSFVLLLCTLLFSGSMLSAQEPARKPVVANRPQTQVSKPAPVTQVIAEDHPNDKGDAIDVNWTLSVNDTKDPDARTVIQYQIERTVTQYDSKLNKWIIKTPDWITVGKVDFGKTMFTDTNAKQGKAYTYRVTALAENEVAAEVAVSNAGVAAKTQWFDRKRSWFAVILLLICGSVVVFILIARAGYPLKLRKIAGLEVVDEAVGRATEMGRTTLFIPGILDMNDIQTVAAMTVLSHVATTAAEYDSEIEVPTCRSLVMTTAQETVEAAFLSAGRPDAYNAEKIYYVTDEQFGYVAYLTGKMVREKPAACFYMGAFYAESLILAETGNAIGAIQIAGTAMPAQLPFFVAACDYTLIGEEFFAASAYLSKEPDQLGSLKGQDVGKILVAALLIFGSYAATFKPLPAGTESSDYQESAYAIKWIIDAHTYLTETILDVK